MTQPVLWVIAGPNGAGKSRYWHNQGPRFTNAAFVNADDLARAHFKHPAETEAEARWGQDAAEQQRRALMQAGQSFAMESTFSHESKLALLRDARRSGYALRVFHLHLEHPDLAVKRVAFRVSLDGHPVPEDRIRGRFARNPEIIREAVLFADDAWVLDATQDGVPPVLMLRYVGGQITRRHPDPARWVQRLYLGQPALTPPAPG